ncbi:unnamed protein product [Hymenolepis diminuta]|uniref:Uncharacterized protein n=1 Tax=Hymenolepis diminuta TaxID=6216 RepID=A0A564YZ32_HYMDI|nr:unnamed protein product [Hymenolepis diminuta]
MVPSTATAAADDYMKSHPTVRNRVKVTNFKHSLNLPCQISFQPGLSRDCRVQAAISPKILSA